MAELKGEGPEDVDTIGIYVGARNKDGDRHGEGWTILPNGDYYTGWYCKSQRNGKGLYVFMKNGARYDGEWRRAVKYGVGTMIYPDGSRYEGDWKHDLKQGFGAYYYPNGDIYEGAWFKGRRHGLGTYYFSEYGVKFMGTWVNGTIAGPGQIIYPRYRFHGAWTKGKPKGPGCFVFDTNCMQHGFYILVKTIIEEMGEGDEEKLEKEDMEKVEGEGEEEEEDEMAGMTSVWRARNVTAYMAEFLPPEPVPLPIHDSVPSLTDESCSQFHFEPPDEELPPEYEEVDQFDSWMEHRKQFLEDPDNAKQEK